jgi:predicted ArsR family transcriptional regulator
MLDPRIWMQTSKTQILSLLKRRGGLAVDALADELGLAPMTVRQHLASLERDRLIQAAAERQPKGRPHYIYTLTDRGESTFPKRYGWLAAEVLTELGRLNPLALAGLTPPERTEYVLDRIADRIVALHLTRLSGLPIEERVRGAAEVLQSESGFVEWARTSDGFEIDDYNCMYRALTGETSDACSWHRRIISRLVGLPSVAGSSSEAGVARCRCLLIANDRNERSAAEQPTPTLDGIGQLISQEVH